MNYGQRRYDQSYYREDSPPTQDRWERSSSYKRDRDRSYTTSQNYLDEEAPRSSYESRTSQYSKTRELNYSSRDRDETFYNQPSRYQGRLTSSSFMEDRDFDSRHSSEIPRKRIRDESPSYRREGSRLDGRLGARKSWEGGEKNWRGYNKPGGDYRGRGGYHRQSTSYQRPYFRNNNRYQYYYKKTDDRGMRNSNDALDLDRDILGDDQEMMKAMMFELEEEERKEREEKKEKEDRRDKGDRKEREDSSARNLDEGGRSSVGEEKERVESSEEKLVKKLTAKKSMTASPAKSVKRSSSEVEGVPLECTSCYFTSDSFKEYEKHLDSEEHQAATKETLVDELEEIGESRLQQRKAAKEEGGQTEPCQPFYSRKSSEHIDSPSHKRKVGADGVKLQSTEDVDTKTNETGRNQLPQDNFDKDSNDLMVVGKLNEDEEISQVNTEVSSVKEELKPEVKENKDKEIEKGEQKELEKEKIKVEEEEKQKTPTKEKQKNLTEEKQKPPIEEKPKSPTEEKQKTPTEEKQPLQGGSGCKSEVKASGKQKMDFFEAKLDETKEEKVVEEKRGHKKREFGTEYCKLVKVYYCKLCKTHLPRGKNMKKAVNTHCLTREHLQRLMWQIQAQNWPNDEEDDEQAELGGDEDGQEETLSDTKLSDNSEVWSALDKDFEDMLNPEEDMFPAG